MANKGAIAPGKWEVLTPERARYLAEAEGRDIMQEYTRLRKVAQERLRKLKKAGFTDYEIWKDNINRFPSKKEIGSDFRLLYDAIADVSHFLALKRSTVGGQNTYFEKSQAKFSQHYNKEGLTGLDWKAFGSMMESIKKSAKSKERYAQWKTAYRAALSKAAKRGMSAEDLNRAISEGKMSIGAQGGLYHVSRTGKRY